MVKERQRRDASQKFKEDLYKYYYQCLSKFPAVKAYGDAYRREALKASLPIPTTLGLGRATFGTIQGVRSGLSLAASIFSDSNIYILAGSAMTNVLFSSPQAATRAEYEAAKPAYAQCSSETNAKFGGRYF